jgi:hypothetical protein
MRNSERLITLPMDEREANAMLRLLGLDPTSQSEAERMLGDLGIEPTSGYTWLGYPYSWSMTEDQGRDLLRLMAAESAGKRLSFRLEPVLLRLDALLGFG